VLGCLEENLVFMSIWRDGGRLELDMEQLAIEAGDEFECSELLDGRRRTVTWKE
jgi:hypothetical protein